MSTIPLPEPSAQPESSAVSRMTGVILAPGKTFAEIAQRPTWVAPFVILCILSIGVSALLAQKTDWRGFFLNGRWPRIHRRSKCRRSRKIAFWIVK